MIELKSITEVEVKGKRVVLRLDMNVPLTKEGGVADIFRLERALPTIRDLSSRGAKIIILSHFGREGDSLRPVAGALASMAGVPMTFSSVSFEEAAAATAGLEEGKCVVLENVRRDRREETNDDSFAQLLAGLGELFVNDAFGASHRGHASIVGITKFLPSYAGLLIQEEVAKLCEALTPPKGSVAIVGGAKFETKEPVIKKLLPLYDRICVGGALANDFLKARGYELGTSLVSKSPVPPELAIDPRILVEHDVLVLREGGYNRIASYEDIRIMERVVDAGPQTAAAWSEQIQQAPFILWNGPIGIYEEGYTTATDTLARAISQSSGHACVGGGDTLAAIGKFEFDDAHVFRSTGGGAMLEFLGEGTLVGIEPLKKN